MWGCAACGSATRPEDRFCAACGNPLEQRCGACATVLPPDARFCPSCGTPVAEEPAGTADAEHAGEERKVISVLFADLVGFTASSDGADPEDVRRRLRPYHTAIRTQVERYGGRIEKLMGDGVLAVFGAPVVHEDDAERAVRAGLRVQGAVEELAGSAGLRARVAVGTGEAVVLLEGTTMDREGLVGDVVNTASRLQAEAPPGAVLVDEATQRATRRAIRYEERPPVVVKGKAEPLSVWVAVEPTARFGADVEDDGAPLVGRSAELALVIDAFGRAAGGSTQMVTIAGEPGVGKSRLVRELRRHIDDLPDLTRWRQGRCLPYGEGITWWALGDVAKAEAGVLETDTPATALGKLAASLEPVLADPEERAWVAGRLAPLVGSEADAASEAAERYAAWHRYLAALAEQRPTVVVIEDLHWADAALVEFLADVPDAARGTPLLLVCTARPDFFERFPAWGGGQRNALTVRLEPLDAEATRSLLDGLLAGEDLDDDTRRAVAERSGGNPLWAQEFVRMVHDRRDGTGDLAIPDTVQAVVASRIDLLESGPKTVLQAAALIGKSFWSGAVAAMLEEPIEVDDALHELARRELIRRERTSTFAGQTEYAFTHSVVRDVAAAGAPRAVRAIRHHRAARWIEAAAGDRVSDKTEMIAHHDADALRLAAATGMADVTRLVDHAVASHRRAAEYAAGLDVSAQRAHLEAALELVGAGDPRRGPLLYELGSAHGAAGATESGNKALFEARVALRDAGDMEGWGLATGVLSRFLWVSGEPDEAEALLDDAAEVLGEMPPGPALASVHAARAASRWLRGASAEALEMIEPIHHVVEVHGDSETRARLMSAEGGARFDAGDPSAIEPFRQVLRMAIEANNSMAIGTAHLNLGEQLRTGWGVAEAIPVHERGIELAVQRHIHGAEQFLRQSLALDYVLAGRWDDAIVQLDASEQIPDRFSYLEGAVIAERTRICAGRNGATERDAELIDEVVLEAEALKDLQAVIPAFDTAQFVHLMAGDEDAANRYARAIVERSGATRYAVDAWPFTVWILRSAGELERAAALLDGLRRFEMPRPRALLAATDALLLERSDPRAAAAGLGPAAEELADLGNAVEAAVLFAEAHRIGRDAGDDAAASHAREAAVRLLEPSGARALAARLGVG